MESFSILYTPDAIRRAIQNLFAKRHAKRRRVACVAFIGADCLDFVPHAKGLEVYCWPQPGGTSADGVNRLIAAGAQVRFADRMHSKVYWTHGVGCLVTSANLSRNALGDSGLAETGVYFPDSSVVDIDRVIGRKLNREVTDQEILELGARSAPVLAQMPRNAKSAPVRFSEWLSHPARAPWKLAWVGDDQEAPGSVEKYRESRGLSEDDSDWAHCRLGEYEPGDWLLVFDPWRVWTPYWMYVSVVIPKRKGEEDAEEYPFSAIQVGAAPPNVPFVLAKPFPRALFEAVKKFGRDKIAGAADSHVPPAFLDLLIAEWNHLSDV